MNFCLLTRFHSRHSQSSFVQRLLAEAEAAGHSFQVINPAEITLAFSGGPPSASASPVRWQGGELPRFDLIHYALRWDDDHTWHILETLRDWGQPVLPSTRVPLGDSITMTRLFARAGIRTPRTWVMANATQLPIILPELPFPCTFRVRKGEQGRKVYLVNHSREALELAETLSLGGFNFMVQEIMPPTGVDVRAVLVGGQVIAAVERVAPMSYIRPGEDGNLRVLPTALSEAETKLVQAAMRIYNAPYAAVSFLRRNEQEPILLEVSRTPALTEIEATTGANVAGAIIAHLAAAARPA